MKTKLQRLLKPLGIVAAAAVIVMALGFVERTSDRTPVTELRVEVGEAGGVHFVDGNTVRERVLAAQNGLVGTPMGGVDAARIETDLRTVPFVRSADVYHTMDGVLHVRVEQRTPIVRVINSDGTSFYIDRDGMTMPLSDAWTARVLVATGDLHEPFATGTHDTAANDSLTRATRSAAIHRLAAYIGNDPAWSALIDQVVVDARGEFELVPRIGQMRIAIGNGEELDQRFAKLRGFYAKGIAQGGWRKYARIDLRFTDQVVATERTPS